MFLCWGQVNWGWNNARNRVWRAFCDPYSSYIRCRTPPLTREAPGGDGGLLQRPPPALLTTDTFIPAHNTTTCTMRPLGKAAAASGKAADGTHRGRPMRRLKGSSATQLPGAPRGLRVVQAASGSASHLEATAAPRTAQETAVLGSEGRLQLAQWRRRRHVRRHHLAPGCRHLESNMIPAPSIARTAVPKRELSARRPRGCCN